VYARTHICMYVCMYVCSEEKRTLAMAMKASSTFVFNLAEVSKNLMPNSPARALPLSADTFCMYVCMYVCMYACMYVYFSEWNSNRVLVRIGLNALIG
jgi:hypothetical protein